MVLLSFISILGVCSFPVYMASFISDIVNVEIDTGRPIVYELDDELKPIRHYYVDEN